MPSWKLYPHRRTRILQVEGYNGKLPDGTKDRATWTTGVDVDIAKWAASAAYRKRMEAEPDVAGLMAELHAKWPVYVSQVAVPTMKGYKVWGKAGPVPVMQGEMTLAQLADAWIDGKAATSAAQTLRKYRELRDMLATFAPDDTATAVDVAWHDRFAAWLRTPRGKAKATATSSTVAKRTEQVKAMLKWAHDRGLHHATAWRRLSAKVPTKAPGFYLTDGELAQLSALLTTQCTASEARILHGFLLACYTGMRHSDVRALTQEQVQDGWLEYVPIKTRNVKPRPIRVPVLPHIAPHLAYVLAHGVPDNQYSNKVLHVLARRAKLLRLVQDGEGRAAVWRAIGFHTSRRTFIASCIRRGMEFSIITRLVGHSTIKQLFAYRDVMDGEVDAAMRDAWK